MIVQGTHKKVRQQKAIALIVATLSGGSLMQTCQSRFRDGVVDGTKNFVLSLLDPTRFIEEFTGGNEP